MRIVFELTVHDYIKLFLILAELVGIVIMVFLLVDSLRDKPDKGISKNPQKQKGVFLGFTRTCKQSQRF